MKIKRKILNRINNVASRRIISAKLDISDQMLYKHMRQNASDGPLTKMKALMAISEEAGIDVNQALEEMPVSKK